MKTWMAGLAVVWLTAGACSKSDDMAAREEGRMRAAGRVVNVVRTDNTLVYKNLADCSGPDYWDLLDEVETFRKGFAKGERDAGGTGSSAAPLFDLPMLVKAGITRIECEDGHGHVSGTALPYRPSKALVDRRAAEAAQHAADRLSGELMDLDRRMSVAVQAVISASTDAERASARARLVKIQGEAAELNARIQAARTPAGAH